MEKIIAKEKSIRELLSNQKYYVDYYQREYKWQTKQVQDLINDFVETFENSYDPKDSLENVQNYDKYFLGSIIICEKDNKKFIVDGQQRLVTITLLLIYLRNKIKDEDQRSIILPLIFSTTFGKKTYNIDVEERRPYLDELMKDNIPETNNLDESTENIIKRYIEIRDFFPEDFDEKKYIYFSNWIIENVYMVEIITQSEDDAYVIFETMNDRGLSLTPIDMLKGYLLANIKESDKRNTASKIWKNAIESLRENGKDEASEAFKAWLRGKYAENIREKKKGAKPQDFDKIGTELHRWVREKEDFIGLKSSNDFYNFIVKNVKFYTERYKEIREANQEKLEGLETLYYLGYLKFTLQYPILLAPINIDDDKKIITKKYQLVGTYLDILIARRIWNYKGVDYKNMQYIIFNTIKEIRNKSFYDLGEILLKKLREDKITFLSNKNFKLSFVKFYVHYLLARMTEYVEIESGMKSHFVEYIEQGPNRYEIEHILSKSAFDTLKSEFSSLDEFEDYRNRIGGLLLLPKKFNASYGDLSYREKLGHYFGQNLLAKSLHEECYKHNPGFIDFIKRTGLPFKPHLEFRKKDLEERQNLYCQLAELVWSPKRIEKILEES
ncbi:MAG: DUF262 domain-containing HNH endonuclease family protein [Elusimicrobiota bacterium]|nr:DUF262 domain-containing HNH endonuclease family protein [Endomicrobiia bacterium]MDW8166342.1 DUF262 domain-containing HNH endonuclease family protein [Elusimicrobiota bacterium]